MQLVNRRDALLPDLYEAYTNDVQHLGTLESIVLQLLGFRVRAYIVVDALDECPDDCGQAQDVLDGLHRLSASAEHVRILTTSRTEFHDDTISERTKVITILTLGDLSIQEDLRLFVTDKMERFDRFGALTTTTQLDDGGYDSHESRFLVRVPLCQIHSGLTLKSFYLSLDRARAIGIGAMDKRERITTIFRSTHKSLRDVQQHVLWDRGLPSGLGDVSIAVGGL